MTSNTEILMVLEKEFELLVNWFKGDVDIIILPSTTISCLMNPHVKEFM